MTDQITLKTALELVEFERGPEGWRVKHVKNSVWGSVWGSVWNDVWGSVWGNVRGTINGRQWQFVETPMEKLKCLIEEGADKAQLLEAVNQLEDSND